jgi:serine/threonine protein kinase
VLKRFRDKNFLVVKELQTELMPDYEAAKVMTEIELLNKLKTEGTGYVVNYEDAFVEGTCVNIVQEYCEKGDLSALINRRRHRTPA